LAVNRRQNSSSPAAIQFRHKFRELTQEGIKECVAFAKWQPFFQGFEVSPRVGGIAVTELNEMQLLEDFHAYLQDEMLSDVLTTWNELVDNLLESGRNATLDVEAV
jgi:hypothetical protein